MSGNAAVIDNEKVVLLDQLREILPQTKRASIAIGYFFISGFAEIMDSLEKIEKSPDPNDVLRLLISPTTNRKTAEALLAENEAYVETRKVAEIEDDEESAKENAGSEVRRTLEYMPQTEKDRGGCPETHGSHTEKEAAGEGIHQGQTPRQGVHIRDRWRTTPDHGDSGL